MSTLVSSLSSISGTIEKAYILIFDSRSEDPITILDPPAASSWYSGIVDSIKNGVGKVNDFLESVTTSLSTLNGGNPTIEALKSNENTKLFFVPFNPSTLHVRGHAGGIRTNKKNFASAGGSASSGSGRNASGIDIARITMDVTLIFDKSDPSADFFDSFDNKKDYVKGQIEDMFKPDEPNDVLPYVEAFLAAMQDNKTRFIAFCWGQMIYMGWLRSTSVRYTMFNAQGAPVRAEVDLSLLCADPSIGPSSMGLWKQAYLDVFESNSSSVSTGQYVSSLLNLSL